MNCAKNVDVPGNLKFAADPLPVDDRKLTALWKTISKRPIWIAASTHNGEENAVADAHCSISSNYPDLLTIIIPRHPIRGKEIATSLSNRGLMISLRSENHTVQPETEIYIADTVGELGLFYRLSPIAFIGGTLIPHGGQNLLEAAKLDCAIIHGPSTDNFNTITREISNVDGSIVIENNSELADAVCLLLADEERRQTQILAAANVAGNKSGILETIMHQLSPFLDSFKDSASTRSKS